MSKFLFNHGYSTARNKRTGKYYTLVHFECFNEKVIDINSQDFLDELDNLTFVFANKTKFKRKCLDLSHALSAKRTTLFNSVTMALLGQPSARVGGSKSMLNANISNTTRSKVDSPHESQERETHAPPAHTHA